MRRSVPECLRGRELQLPAKRSRLELRRSLRQQLLQPATRPVRPEKYNTPILPVRQCEWDVSITVTPASRLLGCSLNATVESTVTQLTVYDATDPAVYQCMDTQATYLLNEPNDHLSPVTLFDDVVFPVDVQVEDDPFASSSGPYFGDTSVEVPYVRLFDTVVLL